VLTELRKHASTSSALRRLALEKEAGLLGLAGKAAMGIGKKVGATILTHPIGAATAFFGGQAALGQAKKTTALFNPASHRMQLGIQP
jgi:hypothetical protein